MMLVLVFLGTLASAVASGTEKYDAVNVFIGSGGSAYGYGGVNPGAQVPFGAMRLGPDTTLKDADLSFRHFSGYNYADDTIRGFSHTHLVGAGINDLGNFGVMPYNIRHGSLNNSINFWWSKFSKETESGSPGMYNVHLDEPDVDVQLLALSNFAAVHRYTWNGLNSQAGQHPGFIVDVCHAAKLETDQDPASLCSNATFSADGTRFRAAVSFNGGFTRKMWMYLHGELVIESNAVRPAAWQMCSGERLWSLSCASTNELQSTQGKLYATQSFDVDKRVLALGSFSVQLRVGLSFISGDVAEANLADALADSKDILKLQQRTQNIWTEQLDKLDLSAVPGDEEITPLLYSALYRSLLSPTDYTEHDGLYVGADHAVHNVTAERSSMAADGSAYPMRFYSDLSFWDTFRTLHPWQLLFSEPLATGVVRSVAELTVQQNAFPRWILGQQEASCMVGLHGAAFVLEAAYAGLKDQFDLLAVQRVLLTQSTQNVPLNGRDDVEFYLSNGYVSQEAVGDAATLTVTFAFDDYVLAGISTLVGDTSSASAALQRSKNYANIWSADEQIFCNRYRSGEMNCPKTPTSVDSWQMYREGDALHWLYFVPHDTEGLMALYPSVEAFDSALTAFMDKHVQHHEIFGNALPNPYYWAGNEHNHIAPYLFNFGSNCTKTQYWARKLTTMHFSNTAHGDPGNEDYGAMSTWLLFTSLGLYPIAGTTTFLIGSPRVASASVRLERWQHADTVLRVVTHNNSLENVFVQRVLINGVALDKPFVDRSVLVGSEQTTIEFYMHSEDASDLCAAAKP